MPWSAHMAICQSSSVCLFRHINVFKFQVPIQSIFVALQENTSWIHFVFRKLFCLYELSGCLVYQEDANFTEVEGTTWNNLDRIHSFNICLLKWSSWFQPVLKLSPTSNKLRSFKWKFIFERPDHWADLFISQFKERKTLLIISLLQNKNYSFQY